MGISIRDTKILWSRAGNRCAFPDCRIELIVGGDPSIIGEMAHIVAQSPDGPRGDNELPLDKRDEYGNLILLCPTHHTLVDKCPDEWPVTKLLQMKKAHEEWVTQQLDAGRITIKSPDNTQFLQERRAAWLDTAAGGIWVVLCVTPLDVTEEVLDPLEITCVKAVNQTAVPVDTLLSPIVQFNSYFTRPSENGVINEELRDIKKGIGYQLEVFRVGHCEFLMSLEGSVKQITDYENSVNPSNTARIIRYTDLLDVIVLQARAVKRIWDVCLPFYDLLFSITILNTTGARLYSYDRGRMQEPVMGNVVKSGGVNYSAVISREDDIEEVLFPAARRIVNSFGLELPSLRDANGNPRKPEFFRSR